MIRLASDGSGVAPPHLPQPERKEVQAVVFADSAGNPLFFPRGIECPDACLRKYQPALAGAGAQATGDWALVGRGTGKLQWSFQGKPLYIRVGEIGIGEPALMYTDDPMDIATPYGIALNSGLQDGMQLALVEPQQWTRIPFALRAAEYRLAPGQVLAVGVTGDNPTGRAIYAFSGTAAQEKKLPRMFKPHYAAEFDLPIGDFTIHERPDGTRQWAYKGAALYTCDCDISLGDLNGKGRVPGMAPAVLLHYYLPPQVAIKGDPLAVGHMVQAKTGKTLYYHDRPRDEGTPDHARPSTGTANPGICAALALKHCDAQCEKAWPPLLAPKDAQPRGYWSTYQRPDGAQQWAYKNCALYTHANEKPGTLDGNETWDIKFEDGFGGKAAPTEFGLGLAWRAVVP
jgi:predicted lipoprotein with Yx(FWY)xxD motif